MVVRLGIVALFATGCAAPQDLEAQRRAAFSTAVAGAFTWTEQRPGHEFHEADLRGQVSEQHFLRIVSEYPYDDAISSRRPDAPEPTITLQSRDLDRYLSISPFGYADDHVFYLFWGVGSTGSPPRFLPVDGLEQVAGLSRLFFAGNVAKLDHIFEVEGGPLEEAFE